MKIKESYLQQALKAEKNEKPNWTSESRRQNAVEHTDTPNKIRSADSLLKEELKFANLLESSAKLQKPNQQQNSEDSGEESRDNEKKDKKNAELRKEAEQLAGDEKIGKYGSSGGQTGGQGGFGLGANIGGLNLSENFAARSILHIADLERILSTIRTQINLGGKREIILQLKRSVLEGLQVKILTDPTAKVQIEFLAANEKVRQEIEKHSEELAGILRGRGVNLENITTSIASNQEKDENSSDKNEQNSSDSIEFSTINNDDLIEENTFVN